MDKIRPCPFCGEQPKLVPRPDDDAPSYFGRILCVNPRCHVQPSLLHHRLLKQQVKNAEYLDDLVKLWNHRYVGA